MWRRRAPGTVMYAGGPDITRGLAYLCRAGARLRLASVFHTVRPVRRGDPYWIKVLDLAVAISRRGRHRLIEEYGRDPGRTFALPWGPDLDFPFYEPAGDEMVVSAGQTNRDIETLLAALTRIRARARVYVPPDSAFTSTGEVEVVRIDPERPHWVLDDMARASVIAIPLVDPDRLSGITELNDALGLAKPIVITRSPEIDVDEPRDVDGWVSSLEELLADAHVRRSMGERGRAWAREHWNSDLFGERLASAFEDTFGT
jgi:nucleotide-binding universal stress UspA family protein